MGWDLEDAYAKGREEQAKEDQQTIQALQEQLSSLRVEQDSTKELEPKIDELLSEIASWISGYPIIDDKAERHYFPMGAFYIRKRIRECLK